MRIPCWWELTKRNSRCPGIAGLSGPTMTVFFHVHEHVTDLPFLMLCFCSYWYLRSNLPTLTTHHQHIITTNTHAHWGPFHQQWPGLWRPRAMGGHRHGNSTRSGPLCCPGDSHHVFRAQSEDQRSRILPHEWESGERISTPLQCIIEDGTFPYAQSGTEPSHSNHQWTYSTPHVYGRRERILYLDCFHFWPPPPYIIIHSTSAAFVPQSRNSLFLSTPHDSQCVHILYITVYKTMYFHRFMSTHNFISPHFLISDRVPIYNNNIFHVRIMFIIGRYTNDESC